MFSERVFGSCLWDFHKGNKEASVTVHSPDFDDDEIQASYLNRTFKQMPAWEQVALKSSFGRILDVGSCAGVHSKYLQDKGFEVCSLEMDALACEYQLKVTGVKRVVNCDFASWESNESFDTILLMMNGLGIAGKLISLPSFLSYCVSFLKPGGQILVESSDLAYLYDGDLYESEGYYGEIEYQVSYGSEKSKSFPWLFVDVNTLQEFCSRQDLSLKVLYHGSENYLAQITKP